VSAPLVSVVVATDRHSAYLEEALASVAGQTYAAWEGLLVDDGVPDPAALAEVVARQPGFRLLRTGAHCVSRARNTAVAQARGRYLAFLDDDDRWHPEHLARLVAALEAAPAAVAGCCPVNVVDAEGRLLLAGTPPRRVDARAVLRRDVWVACPNLVVRRDAFAAAGGFDPALSRAEDLDLALTLAGLGEVVGVDAPLVDYRVHGANVTADRVATAASIGRVVRAHRAAAVAAGRADLVRAHDASLRRNLRYAAYAVRTAGRRQGTARRRAPARWWWLAGEVVRTPWRVLLPGVAR